MTGKEFFSLLKRRRPGLRSRDIARFLDISDQAVSSWKRRDKIPTDKYPQIAELLGVTTDFLYTLDSGDDGAPSASAAPRPVEVRRSRLPKLFALLAALEDEAAVSPGGDEAFERFVTDLEHLIKISMSLPKDHALSDYIRSIA